jgi:hypothetical protein
VQFIGTLLLLHDGGLLHVAWIINFRTLFSTVIKSASDQTN